MSSSPALHRLLAMILLASYTLYFFGSIAYYGDDASVLQYADTFNIEDHINTRVRPLELFVGFLSLRLGVPVWFVVSIAFAWWTAVLAHRTAALFLPDRMESSTLLIVFAIGNPLYAQLLFQVDTVSQVLGNAFSLAALLSSLLYLRTKDAKHFLGLCAWSILAVTSKETFIALSAFPFVVLVVLWPKLKAAHVVGLLAMLVTLVAWVSSRFAGSGIGSALLTGSGSRYSVSWDLADLLQNIVFSLSAPLNPVPTFTLATSAVFAYAYIATGVAVVGLLAYALSAIRSHVETKAFLVILGFISLLASPLILVHSAELYASALAPVLMVVMVTFLVRRTARLNPIYAGAVLLFACSIANSLVLAHLKCDALTRSGNPSTTCHLYPGSSVTAWLDRPYSLYQEIEEPIFRDPAEYVRYLADDRP